ncbi:hypothetical protein AG1IA_08315 [Rhizoctonia solani AG-1 IA]|uniref:Uncharacterized protein n=1 Tax=Thanatephorus cucumeris (strain AG1-IA) TaxID=983506 RepID=L8WLL2_THACA|nr:hypothetical protein AG1IA_08315 [Rhizoctonia solani AG-1 IA]
MKARPPFSRDLLPRSSSLDPNSFSVTLSPSLSFPSSPTMCKSLPVSIDVDGYFVVDLR